MGDLIGFTVDRYLPPRMVNHRRHLAQELHFLVSQSKCDGSYELALKLASQPLWKRIWVAITKDY